MNVLFSFFELFCLDPLCFCCSCLRNIFIVLLLDSCTILWAPFIFNHHDIMNRAFQDVMQRLALSGSHMARLICHQKLMQMKRKRKWPLSKQNWTQTHLTGRKCASLLELVGNVFYDVTQPVIRDTIFTSFISWETSSVKFHLLWRSFSAHGEKEKDRTDTVSHEGVENETCLRHTHAWWNVLLFKAFSWDIKTEMVSISIKDVINDSRFIVFSYI